ncbi:MAG: DNA/RNA nuclease SfsA [Ruminococcaceae bacterium]|nr:DNA/RNA nuclease SfsA [Oscillospiraceae bacterium]
MEYKNIHPAIFKSRPNRFIANVELEGKPVVTHVKNTGRCRELLMPDASVLLEESDNPTRKTKYDLVSVYKGDRLINMDSQAPNRLFFEWVKAGNLFADCKVIRPETSFKNSRFDFYIEADGERHFVEVKGVTLEKNNIALFPDAPTERGVKHLNELIAAKEAGFSAWVVFVIQMKGITRFSPNDETHPAFGEALRKAEKAGVRVLALDCNVSPGIVNINGFVPVVL